MRYMLVVGLIAGLVGAAYAAEGAPLKVTEPVGVERVNAVATGGVPVGPLGVKDVTELVVLDAAGKPVAAQVSPLVTHEDGHLLWVLVDLKTDLKANETKAFTLAKGSAAPPAVEHRVWSKGDDRTFTLTNGLVQVVLSESKFNLFDSVWVDRNGDGKFADDERMLDAKQPAALVVVRGKDGQVFSTRDGKVQKVTLEDAGALRATVRIDGDFGDTAGAAWLKYTARLTMWAGRPDIKVLYSIRNTNPAAVQEEQIRRAAVTLKLAPLAGKAHYLVGAGEPKLSQLSRDENDATKPSQWHSRVRLSQVGLAGQVTGKSHRTFYHLVDFDDAGYRVQQFQPGNRRPFVDVGFKASGWLDLAGDNAGCQVWLRNFSYETPKQIEAAVDGTMTVDLLPEHAGKGQPYYANGGYWLGDQSYATYELNFRFHARPLVTAADWKLYDTGLQAYVSPTPETAARAETIARQADDVLQLVAAPEWYTQTGDLWGPVPSLAEERTAAEAMGYKNVGPVRPKPPQDLVSEFVAYVNFHYYSEWDEPGDAILEFLRTGDWSVYKRAHAFARNYRDLGVPRTDGLPVAANRPQGAKGPNVAAIPRWGKFCGCHNYGSGVFDCWLVTGDRSYRDAGIDFGYASAHPPVVRNGFGDRGWARQMIAVIRTYQVTRDPKLRTWLIANCRPPVPTDAQRQDGRAVIAGTTQGAWMVGLSSHAVWHNWLMHRNALDGVERDDYRDGILGVAWNVAKYWWFDEYKGGPYYVTFDANGRSANGGGAAYTISSIDMMTRGYLLTGDKRLLDAAKKFWNAANGADATTQSLRLQDFQGMGSASFWARQLIYELAHPRKDAEAPKAVTDLKAEPLGGGSVKLTWTAPADQGGGKVVEYQLKHAPCPIVAFPDYNFPADKGKTWTFWAAYNVPGEPKPAAPGALESITLTLPAGVRHLALVSRDDSSNESALSNVVQVEVK